LIYTYFQRLHFKAISSRFWWPV